MTEQQVRDAMERAGYPINTLYEEAYFGDWVIDMDTVAELIVIRGRNINISLFIENIQSIKDTTDRHFRSDEISSIYENTVDTLIFEETIGTQVHITRSYVEEGMN